MVNKTIHQLVTPEGKPAAAATSAPGCFIQVETPLRGYEEIKWADPFGKPSPGNKVNFYVTGEEYFNAVAAAIGSAKEEILIAGWQVNFDVELSGGKTLFEHLQKAMERSAGLKVYVMPWMSPKVGVDTGDFETMLAVFQLNAGDTGKPRAFALPAMAQSDLAGGLAIGFSHHQKLVVVDRERAFVGGIDLAYGRRDNGEFRLKHCGRTGNELYNSCIPAVYELTHQDQKVYLTRAEMISACYEGWIGRRAQWWTSPSGTAMSYAWDFLKTVSDKRTETQKRVSDWWTSSSIVPEFVYRAADVPVDAAQRASTWAYENLNKNARGMLDTLRASGAANAADVGAGLVAWLNHAKLDQLPSQLRQGTMTAIQALMLTTLRHLAAISNERSSVYEGLLLRRKMVPPSGKVLSSLQPRMPWHDVHSSIEGPAVYDLCRNFSRRWNGIAHQYERSQRQVAGNPVVAQVLGAFRANKVPMLEVPRIVLGPPTATPVAKGSCWVQVLRSAPVKMQRDEELALNPSNPKGISLPQNNCLKAMLTAIQGAQKFIYIEGQFFQSEFGRDASQDQKFSGPMAALLDLTASEAYEWHARKLGIYGVPPNKIPKALIWSKVDDVMRDTKGKDADFINDLMAVLGNIASVEASKLLGSEQDRLKNPIGHALATRIERAVFDDLDFHVYIVVPVHPEGTLNTLNIMSQLNLTMQSLVFGSESLVVRTKHAIAARKLIKNSKNMGVEQARNIARSLSAQELDDAVGISWKDHLTLLNLRNWEDIGGRPVTEQIYVHSKLLIADDRVAVLGSANINDRSQLGGRDSELAVVVRDDKNTQVKLDGRVSDAVSTTVHDLRIRLWRKLFGFMGGANPATRLEPFMAQPAARTTWRAIQRTAEENLTIYADSFPFLPRPDGSPSSIWPTWNPSQRKLAGHMPFSARFWRGDEVADEHFTWEASKRAPERAPMGVKGYIVALPTSWTENENNMSGMNLTLLAENSNKADAERYAAASTPAGGHALSS
jgi:phospholipase D1/2